MPSAPSEQTDLRRRGRQRLIGAAALALVAAVVVPMVLDPDAKPSSPAPLVGIPDRSLVTPLPAPEPASVASADPAPLAEQARSAGPSPNDSPELAPSEAAKPAESFVAKVEVPAKKVEAPRKAQGPAKAGSPVLAGFAVQAGAFRDDVRLAQARKKLTAAGIRHYTERIEAKGGDLTRLRAGPFADREAAAAAAAKMKTAGLDATIVSLP